MFIAILIAWNLPILRDVIAGLKVNLSLFRSHLVADIQLFTVGVHELCHLAVGLLCGGQVVSICIDPNDGGATHVLGLMRNYPRVLNDPYAMPTFTQLFWSPSAVATLAAGYVGSAVVGFVLVVSLKIFDKM
jgi:hypothetical protein